MQQQQERQHDNNLNQKEEQMRKVEEERDQDLNDLKQMKRVAEETNVMIDEALGTKRFSEPHVIKQQRSIKEKKNNNMESSKYSNKDAALDNMKNEMDSLRSSEANAMALLSDYKRKIQELEAELDKRRESETNLFDTLVMQTKQLEQNKILLEESKLEITSLEEKLTAAQISASQTIKIPVMTDEFSTRKNADSMEIEPELEKGMFNGDDELPKKPKNMLDELNILKNELKLATEAEENSKKAMDDLVFALKEVATEANQVKAKLTLSQVELEHTKGDAERLRTMLANTEEKYKEILEATKKDADRYKNTAERLRLEAEESLSAWNGKETELVNCIRQSEEERMLAQQETTKLLELLQEAENKTKVSKEENQKLRDILKQALNEANVAKEAAEIAKAENARLQDSLNILVHENEMLKIHEAASFENIRELKRMLSESSSKELKLIEDMDKPKESAKEENNKESTKKAKGHSTNPSTDKSLSKTFSLNLKDMITPHSHHKQQHSKVGNELDINNNKDTSNVDDTLKGSIFDEVDSSSDSERHDVDMVMPDDFDHLDESHFDENENDRNSRKRRALLRRFGDLIRRRGGNHNHNQNHNHNHRKEPSTDEYLQT